MLGDVRFTMFAWGFDTYLLGDEFLERCAWGCGFKGLVCLGTSISAPLLLGDLLGVDLLGSVRQGCSHGHVGLHDPRWQTTSQSVYPNHPS